uniref:Kelch-like protein diablo n=1 Tax=Tetranychus urticae TaxID=32264 RepID=T1L3P7_TETUR
MMKTSNRPDFDWASYLDRSIVLQNLRKSYSFCDILLVSSDNREFPAHLTVLSALGPNFSNVLQSQLNDEKSLERIKLPNISGFVLSALIDCAYKGVFSIPYNRVWDVLATAEEFEMESIITACCNFLVHHLNRENCIELLYLGIKHNHKIRTLAWSMIKREFTWLTDSAIKFSTISLKHLEILLDDDELDIESEELVWKAIKRWINEQPQSTRASQSSGVLIGKLLGYLRHGRVTQAFLTNNLAKDSLIYLDEFTSKLVASMIKHNRYEFGKQLLDGHGFPVGHEPKHIRPRIPGSIIFAIGGWQDGVPTSLIETYDYVTNKWFECKTGQRVPRAYHGIEVIGGVIYLVGGTNGAEILNTVNCFDPESRRWFQKANMYEQRCYVSTAVLDGQLYAMGGHNGLHRIRSVERYDLASNQWTRINEMNLARSDACAAIHENKIFIAGGLNDQVIENSVEMYDPATHRWTLIQPMNSPRTSLALVSYQGSLYALGGNNGFERLPTVERYDFEQESWFSAPSMRSQRSTFSACVLGNYIYAIGGYNGQTPISKVEKFNGTTQEWIGMKNLKYDRSGLSVCVLKGSSKGKDFTYLGAPSKSLLKSGYSKLTQIARVQL